MVVFEKDFKRNYIHIHDGADCLGSDPDQRNGIVSKQRLRDVAFQAKRSLDEGIKELLKGYRMPGGAPFKKV